MNRKTKIALFCICSLILNSVFTFFFFDFLNIPLFMDTIFTVAIVFYFGLVPGLIVGITFNFIDPVINYVLNGVFSPTNMCVNCSCYLGLCTQKGRVSVKCSNHNFVSAFNCPDFFFCDNLHWRNNRFCTFFLLRYSRFYGSNQAVYRQFCFAKVQSFCVLYSCSDSNFNYRPSDYNFCRLWSL